MAVEDDHVPKELDEQLRSKLCETVRSNLEYFRAAGELLGEVFSAEADRARAEEYAVLRGGYPELDGAPLYPPEPSPSTLVFQAVSALATVDLEELSPVEEDALVLIAWVLGDPSADKAEPMLCLAQAQPWELREDISGLVLGEDWPDRVQGALGASLVRIASGKRVTLDDARNTAISRQAFYVSLVQADPTQSAAWYHEQVVAAGYNVSERTLRRDLERRGFTLRLLRRHMS